MPPRAEAETCARLGDGGFLAGSARDLVLATKGTVPQGTFPAYQSGIKEIFLFFLRKLGRKFQGVKNRKKEGSWFGFL